MFQCLQLDRPLAFIDMESTGLNPATDRVVEIAVLRCARGQEPILVSRRINPVVPIPPTATVIHGITDADVSECPRFDEIAQKVDRFLDGCDLAGYGLKKFDLPLLSAEFRRAGVQFLLMGRAVIDVLQIYHSRERRDLQSAFAFYCGKRQEQAHRADQDVLATALILDAQLQHYRDLPQNVGELHRQFMEVDLAGRFRMADGEPVFAFGKHTGRRLRDVANADPGYLDWILASDFFEDVKELVRKAIGQGNV